MYTLDYAGWAVKVTDGSYVDVQTIVNSLHDVQNSHNTYIDKLLSIANSIDGSKFEHMVLTIDSDIQNKMDLDDLSIPLDHAPLDHYLNNEWQKNSGAHVRSDNIWHIYVEDPCYDCDAYVRDLVDMWFEGTF